MDGYQTTDGRDQKSEVGKRQRSEVGGQRSEVRGRIGTIEGEIVKQGTWGGDAGSRQAGDTQIGRTIQLQLMNYFVDFI
jgi:hypothetical protein